MEQDRKWWVFLPEGYIDIIRSIYGVKKLGTRLFSSSEISATRSSRTFSRDLVRVREKRKGFST